MYINFSDFLYVEFGKKIDSFKEKINDVIISLIGYFNLICKIRIKRGLTWKKKHWIFKKYYMP